MNALRPPRPVLSFKQKRKLVNTAYQQTADNIVGKITMAKLNAELVALELFAPSQPKLVPTSRFWFSQTPKLLKH